MVRQERRRDSRPAREAPPGSIMQYENTPISQNIEDWRGQGGGGGMMGGGGIGILGIIAVFAISYFTGINPAVLMGGAEMVSKSMN